MGDTSNNRTVWVGVRLTAAENARLYHLSTGFELSKSEIMRRLLRDARLAPAPAPGQAADRPQDQQHLT